MVRLAEVLTPVQRCALPDSGTEYRQVGVRLWGQGAYEREPIDGVQTKYKTLNGVETGDVIINKIWARNGACAVIPSSLAGLWASPEFPTFCCSQERLLPAWVHWLTKTRAFWNACDEASQGTSGKNRVRPDRFLAIRIPLPPIEEQRRIVTRLDAIGTRIKDAAHLHSQGANRAALVYPAARRQVFAALRCERQPLGDLCDLVNGRAFAPADWSDSGRRIVRIQNLKYPQAPYNRYQGPVDAKHIVRAGDVLFAWSGQVVSLGAHVWSGGEAVLNQHIFNVRARVPASAGFLMEALNDLVDEMKKQVRGLEMFHIRKQELEKLPFPALALPEQLRVEARLGTIRRHCATLGDMHVAIRKDIDALLPALLNSALGGQL